MDERPPPSSTTYLVGDLARLSGTTVRTIRYYVEQGLLPHPKLHGRVGLYRDRAT
ncbi:MerR family DNA-binding transcriptional regulator [Streptomyces olivoreticuli]